VEVVPSWVRVTRLTYAEAEARLDEEPLRSLYRIAHGFGQRRREQGAVNIDLPEVRIRVVDGRVAILPLLRSRSRQLVMEAMLMAGEAVARLALREEIPLPFTTQQPPRTEERPTDTAGMFALRRSSFPSDYSLIPGPHAGLGLPVYAQATSPLRRYLDLVVHQQLRAHLRGERLLDAQEIVQRVGATTAVSSGVKATERLARRHWTLVYLMQQPDWQGEGMIVERRRSQATVLVPELDLDVRLHLREDLPLNHVVRLGQSQVKLTDLTVHFRIME
jgi:exoribonuclease-2